MKKSLVNIGRRNSDDHFEEEVIATLAASNPGWTIRGRWSKESSLSQVDSRDAGQGKKGGEPSVMTWAG